MVKITQQQGLLICKVIEDALTEVTDPEMPFISIADLGILRRVEEKVIQGRSVIDIVLTPTFSGCPAMFEIKKQVESVVNNLKTIDKKYEIQVSTELSPPWSSHDLTERGKKALMENGIAVEDEGIRCPRCGSEAIQLISDCGSTRCKKYVRCQNCQEPFEVFNSFRSE